MPVIGIGIVGPPECCVISGYEEEGNVLFGRSYFFTESKGYFRKEEWYKDCSGMILIGNKKDKPPRREILKEALNTALYYAYTKKIGLKITGLDVYKAWIDTLENNENFNLVNMGQYPENFDELTIFEKQMFDNKYDRLSLLCMAINNDGMGYLASARYSASGFLKEILPDFPEALNELEKASVYFGNSVKPLYQGCWECPSSFDDMERKLMLGDKNLRSKLIGFINEAYENDRKAFECIQKVVEKIK